MSGLKIGLVTSVNEESEQLVSLLKERSVEVVFNILPSDITDDHVSSDEMHVWLLKVDDESWDDAIDHLLDESEVPVYFSEPGTLAKQSHPEYWVNNLITRLYEITGLTQDQEASPISEEQSSEADIQPTVSPELSETDQLGKSLDALEISTVGLPSDIAAELVSELENISPVLTESLDSHKTTNEFVDTNTEVIPELEEKSSSNVATDPESETEFNLDIDENETNVELDTSSHEIESVDEVEDDIEIELVDFELQESDAQPVEESIIESVVDDSLDFDEVNSDETGMEELVSSDEGSDEIEILEESLDFDDELSMESLDLDVSIEDDLLNEQTLDSELALSIDDSEPEVIEGTDNSDEQGTDYLISDQEELSFSLEPLEENENIEESSAPAEDFATEETKPESSEDALVNDIGLSLEPVDAPQENVSGKAVFNIDDEEPEDIVVASEPDESENNEEEDFGGLSLEPIEADQKPITGKANFLGDDFELNEDSEGDNTPVSQTDSSETNIESEAVFVENDPVDTLSLESIETDTKADWLGEEKEQQNLDSLESETAQVDQASLDGFDVSEVVTDETKVDESYSFELDEIEAEHSEEIAILDLEDNFSDQEEEVHENLEISPDKIADIAQAALESSHQVEAEDPAINEAKVDDDSEDLAFDIPMLDDTASGIEFDESLDTQAPKATQKVPCWVIGASLGGPAALKRFMHALPRDIGASFIIAQHIDENFLPVLAEILTNNSEFEVSIANGSNEMVAGRVLLAPLNGKTVFLTDGSMLVDRSQKWTGPYSPCINDVIESVSHAYGNDAGAIIFSGMGDDGLNGAIKMRAAGGQVWAQSVETCANSSMPESVINGGETDYVGSPEELAAKLVEYLS